jgi:hypothetical protein
MIIPKSRSTSAIRLKSAICPTFFMRAIGITYTTGRITSTIYVSMRVGKKRKGSEEGRKGKEGRERERERERERG